MQENVTVPILILEDANLDGMALEWALGQASIEAIVTRVESCDDAIATLQDPGAAFYGRPSIVLIDFEMPEMDGHKFLAEVKNDPHLADVIVFVFANTDTWINRMAVFDSQVAAFIKKTGASTDFLEFAGKLKRYLDKLPDDYFAGSFSTATNPPAGAWAKRA